MGSSNSSSNRLRQDTAAFELKEHTKTFCEDGEHVTVHMPQHNIGDYHTLDILNKDYHRFEEKFNETIAKEVKLHKLGVSLVSKEAFVAQILKSNKLRKIVLRVVRRKGLTSVYRWAIWYCLSTNDGKFKESQNTLARRRKLYSVFIGVYHKDLDSMLSKDMLRTARTKALFNDNSSIGNRKLFRVCKAIGLFFPTSGYVQGMNFLAGFVLEVNGMEEFEAFNFIISLWKKEKNLFYGMYQPGFPVLGFMQYAFERLLSILNSKLYEAIQKAGLPPETWISKWFLTFFTLSLEKEYLLRIFDFLIVNDVFGPVYVALVITEQLAGLFDSGDLLSISETIQTREKLSKALCFQEFVEGLKYMDIDNKLKLSILRDYHKSLSGEKRELFDSFFDKYEKHFMKSQLEYYDDLGFDASSNDCDQLELGESYLRIDQPGDYSHQLCTCNRDNYGVTVSNKPEDRRFAETRRRALDRINGE